MDAIIIIPAVSLSAAGLYWLKRWKKVRRAHVKIENEDGSELDLEISRTKPSERRPTRLPDKPADKAD
jgi:hypothetical protein